MSILPERVFLTGASGFLGSHIAETLVANGFDVIATIRSSSNRWRCKEFDEHINWINIDDQNWQQKVINLMPSIIIHSAWMGVSASDRMGWEGQLGNIPFAHKLLQVADQVKPKVFIGFGSQAEYGTFEGKISELYPANPNTAYGVVKIMAYELIRGFFQTMPLSGTQWYWLRLFSFYGEKEDKNWLIPSTIHKMLENEPIEFTAGEQKYAYLYVKDLAKMILQLIDSKAASGIYNISSSKPMTIRSLIEKIKIITKSKSALDFGALPYRIGQSMHIEGDVSKFRKEVGEFKESYFIDNLQHIVNYYMKLRSQ